MRDIRFRAWDGQRMDYEPMIRCQCGPDVVGIADLNRELEHPESNYNKVFLQYTGLKDKNGKETYEGDCLQWEDWEQELTENPDIYVVTWQNDGAKFILNCYRDGNQLDPQDADFRDPTEFEVIGNIMENPELLK